MRRPMSLPISTVLLHLLLLQSSLTLRKGVSPHSDSDSGNVTHVITISALGDLLLAQPQFRDYHTEHNESAYETMLGQLKNRIKSHSLVIGNMENTLKWKPEDVINCFSNHQAQKSIENDFAWRHAVLEAPYEWAQALKGAGIDLVATANNHLADSGERGIRTTLDILESVGFMHSGTQNQTWDSQKLSNKQHNKNKNSRYVIIELEQGLKVGFIAYAQKINKGPEHILDKGLYNHWNPRWVSKDLAQIKQALSPEDGIMIVYIHSGREYQPEPSNRQIDMAQLALKFGADAVLFSHSHIVQPYQFIQAFTDRFAQTKDRVVSFGLGSLFIATHDPRAKGSMLLEMEFTLQKNEDQKDTKNSTKVTQRYSLSAVRPVPLYSIKTQHGDSPNTYEIQILQGEKLEDEWDVASLGLSEEAAQNVTDFKDYFDTIVYNSTELKIIDM